MLTHTRYIIGPFPFVFCQLELLVKQILLTKLIVFFYFGIVVRYIFIFHAKNPTAYQDDFWSFFLNAWAYGKYVCCIFLLARPWQDVFLLHHIPSIDQGGSILLAMLLICIQTLWVKRYLAWVGCRHSSVDSSAPSIMLPGFDSQALHLCFYHL